MHAKINILFVMTGKPHIFGGGKRVFMQIMKGLSKHTFNVFSCCSLSAEQEDELRAGGVRILETHLSQYSPIVSILKLSSLMQSESIHIVHSQGSRADFYSRLAARLAKSPSVVNTSTMLVESYDVWFLRKMFYVLCDQVTERFVDKFIVVSESLRDILMTHRGVKSNKVTIIHNGIELDQYQPGNDASESVRREFLVTQGAFLIGGVGRLVYQKKFDSLVRAIPSVLEIFPKTKVVIIGDGPLKGELERLAEDLRISKHCIFAGFRDDVRDILSALDIFVLPSILEGHPVAILEAMAMKKAIVATDINGVREQIENGRTGILVPPGDPQALGGAIIELLKDRVKARNLGIEARKQVEEMFDIRRQVALHEEVYEELLKNRRNEV